MSDARRLSDVEWFRDVHGDAVQTVRVVASEETRKRRNWVFTAGEQGNAASQSTTPNPGLRWHRGGPAGKAPLCRHRPLAGGCS